MAPDSAPALSALQIALWPSVRQSLIAAHQSCESTQTIPAWGMARSCGLERFALDDLSWQTEAFLSKGAGNDCLTRACQFDALGLAWSRLGPAVAEEARWRVEQWMGLSAVRYGGRDESASALGLWLSSCALLTCVGAGVFLPSAIPDTASKLRQGLPGFAPLPMDLRARCAHTLLALADDASPRTDRLNNKEVFEHYFGPHRPWDNGCALWGRGVDFLQELRLIAQTAEIDAAAGPGSPGRHSPRV